MKNSIPMLVASLVAASFALTSCSGMPTLEAVRYGYKSKDVDVTQEANSVSDYNDVASGWAARKNSDQPTARSGGPADGPARSRQMIGWDGSVVGASAPGTVTTTSNPINGGVGAGDGGSRKTLLDLYTEAVDDREILTTRSEDLSIALEMSETRAADLQEQLKSLQVAYDGLGGQKQVVDQETLELGSRLATAQIARLEAERALLEATIEWRRMSAENNKPLSEDRSRGGRR